MPAAKPAVLVTRAKRRCDQCGNERWSTCYRRTNGSLVWYCDDLQKYRWHGDVCSHCVRDNLSAKLKNRPLSEHNRRLAEDARRQRLAPKLEAAITLLRQNGYTVTPPQGI